MEITKKFAIKAYSFANMPSAVSLIAETCPNYDKIICKSKYVFFYLIYDHLNKLKKKYVL